MAINATEFEFVQKFILDQAGIVLEAGKEYLVEARLQPIARKDGLASVSDVVAAIRNPAAKDVRRRVVDAMTTNETSFFRDMAPFEALRLHVLPQLIAARSSTRRLSFWCGAASTGQEPYTTAMVIREYFPELKNWTIDFLATDLSSDALARAKAGRYGQIEVNRGLPAPLMMKYFERKGLEWEVSASLREMVRFEELNLNKEWPKLPDVDIVFLRNVMIYFDVEAKKKILAKIGRILRPDGFLFLGAAETTINLDESFVRIAMDRTGCYRRADRQALAS